MAICDISNVAKEKISHTQDLIIDKNLLQGPGKILFKIGDSYTYLKVNIDELQKSSNAKVINFDLLPSYKARIYLISPISRFDDFVKKCPHPFFGISLENTNFDRPKLLASLEWIASRYSKCTILIGDSIHRITVSARNNMPLKEAFDYASFLGKLFLQEERQIFHRFKDRCEFDFLFCSEVQQYSDYDGYHEHLKELFKINKNFKESVQSFAINYNSKFQSIVSQSEMETLISSSCAYFLEECAIFACLKKRGYSALIYPGSLNTLSEIASGLHPDVVEELKELTIISLQLKKR